MEDNLEKPVKYISDQRWHVDKSISLGHIVVMAVFVISGVMFFNSQSERISTNSHSIEYLKEQRTEDLRRIEKRLDSIDKKLDSIILVSQR